MPILDGKGLAKTIKEELKEKTAKRIAQGQRPPHLAAVLVGNDGASQTYVASKVRSCQRIGYASTLIEEPESLSQEALLKIIQRLNNDAAIDGFIVQLPLPRQIDVNKVVEAIDPRKDVDGFHPVNIGRMAMGMPAFIAATPLGIMTLLDRYAIDTAGKHCVVLGRSNIVGRPMSILMSRNATPGNCTVTLCHSRTVDLASITKTADILIVALGRPGMVTADMVKEGAIVIDVGITRVPDTTTPKGYVLKGDVAYEEVAPKAGYITPVPGGVGAMTVTGLLLNTWHAAEKTYYP